MKVYLVLCTIEGTKLHKTVKVMESDRNIQQNKLIHLEDSMVMYGVYSTETLQKHIKQYIAYIIGRPYMKNYLQDNLLQHTNCILTHTVIGVYNIML